MEKLIQINNVGKFYPSRLSSLRLLRYLSPVPMRFNPSDFWALRNVSFELERGKVLGLIGRNGMGKSTLLQIIAGLLTPSEGQVTVKGSVAALLELGAGFNQEFTGRENIFLSGSIYGYSREMMAEKFEDIIHFADIGDHLDQPVKTYSSGMFARLAFAVAINVDPELLLVDEILSVGDIEFQAKCFRKIESLRESGMSIVFVSHSLDSINTLCDEAILLNHGEIQHHGPTQETIDVYMNTLSAMTRADKHSGQRDRPIFTNPNPDENLRADITDVKLINSRGQETIHPYSGEHCRIQYRVRFYDDVKHPIVNLQIRSMLGVTTADMTSENTGTPMRPARKGEECIIDYELDLNLCPGKYRLGVGIIDTIDDIHVPLYGIEALTIEVISNRPSHGIAYLNHRIHLETVTTTMQPGNT